MHITVTVLTPGCLVHSAAQYTTTLFLSYASSHAVLKAIHVSSQLLRCCKVCYFNINVQVNVLSVRSVALLLTWQPLEIKHRPRPCAGLSVCASAHILHVCIPCPSISCPSSACDQALICRFQLEAKVQCRRGTLHHRGLPYLWHLMLLPQCLSLSLIKSPLCCM